MKKLLLLFSMLLLLAPKAYADVPLDAVYTDIPSNYYKAPAVSFFAMSSDEILYNRFIRGLSDNCENGALQKDFKISVNNAGLDFYDDDADDMNYLLDIYTSAVYNLPQYGNLITGFIPWGYSEIWEKTDSNGNVTQYTRFRISAIQPLYREIYDEAYYNDLDTDKSREDYLARTHNIDAFNEAVDYAYSKAISPDMTNDLQKLLSIHDYLADTVSYTLDIANGTAEQKQEYESYTNQLAHTTYGALVGDRNCVCQGYSLAFKLLCDMAGIECDYAFCDEINHVWNVVAYNDSYYHIDVTWDDPVVNNGTIDFVTQENFMISEAKKLALIEQSAPHISSFLIESNYDAPSSLTLPLADRINPLYWRGSNFWYKEVLYIKDNKLYKNGTPPCYILSDALDSYTSVSRDAFLPDRHLDSEIFNVFTHNGKNKVAIDGQAYQTADLYVAVIDTNGDFQGAKRLDVTFNAYGEAVAEFTGDYSKLMLFSHNSTEPLSYSK